MCSVLDPPPVCLVVTSNGDLPLERQALHAHNLMEVAHGSLIQHISAVESLVPPTQLDISSVLDLLADISTL